MSQTTQTMEAVGDSLTGFDEIAVTQQFGSNIADLGVSNGTMFARALVFIVKRREGASDEEAKKAAFEMTIKEVGAFFPDETPVDAGKDEQPEEQPGTSLTSVS